MNLERRIKNKSIKENFKQTKTRTKTGEKIQEIKKAVKEKVGLNTTVTPVKQENMEDTNTGKKYYEGKTKKMINKGGN